MDARSDGLPSGGAAAEATIAKTAAEHRSALPKAKLPLEQFPGKLSFARTPGSGLVTRHSYARIGWRLVGRFDRGAAPTQSRLGKSLSLDMTGAARDKICICPRSREPVKKSVISDFAMTKFRFVTPHRIGKWYACLDLAQRFANAIGAGFFDRKSGRFFAYPGTRLEQLYGSDRGLA